jgi:hypothetical protein
MTSSQRTLAAELMSGHYVRATFRDLRGRARLYQMGYVNSWASIVRYVRRCGYRVGEVELRYIDPSTTSRQLVAIAQPAPSAGWGSPYSEAA